MKEAKPFVSDPKVMSMHKELSVKSRVRGDFHARFCERVRVKLPRSTRPMNLSTNHLSLRGAYILLSFICTSIVAIVVLFIN